MNILAIKKNAKHLYAYARVGMFLYGMTRCAEYHEDVKKYIEDLPEGVQMSLSVFGAKKHIVCQKINGKLNCELKDGLVSEDMAYALFKSMDLALPVLASKMTFSDAFNQSRIILKGDTQLGMQFVRMLDITQAYIATPIRRNRYLKIHNVNKRVAFKVKMAVAFRGLV